MTNLKKRIAKIVAKWAKVEIKEPECKLKHTRLPFELTDIHFVLAMAKIWKNGNKGNRIANDWKTMSWNEKRKDDYIGRIWSHIYKFIEATTIEDELEHLASIACNANIIFHHTKKEG